MDIMLGLGAANQALAIVKELREIGRSVDEATFKLKLAEITSALADAKISLAEAQERIASLESDLAKATAGEKCPMCLEGRLKLVEVTPQYQMGLHHFGVEIWKFICDDTACAFEQTKISDPNGAIPKVAGKR